MIDGRIYWLGYGNSKKMIRPPTFCMSSLLVVAMMGVEPIAVEGAGPVGSLVEDFEGFTVPDGSYLDPTTLPGSRWSRNDTGVGTDWEVTCCSPGISVPDDTADGSSRHLRLRRDNNTSPVSASVLVTDFAITPMSEGTVTFEVNPSSIGGGQPAFVGGLFDTSTGQYKVQVRFREITNNTGDFEVFGQSAGAALAVSSNPGGYPASFDRWFRVAMTVSADGSFDVCIDDIGSTSPVSVSGDPARGTILNFLGGFSPAAGVDRLRLDMGAGNGGSNDVQPTMIDNITQEVILEAGGLPVDGVAVFRSKKLTFPTQAGEEYQPQFCDDLTAGVWTDFGGVTVGSGRDEVVFTSTIVPPYRMFRVVEVGSVPQPAVTEDFERYGVANGGYADITTLSPAWRRSDTGSGPDWEVACCSPGLAAADNTFDGSVSSFVLRRGNDTAPRLSELNTDFSLGYIADGIVEVEMNPSSVGEGDNSFHMALHDTVSGADAVRVRYYEFSNNSGDFEVTDEVGTVLATGNVPDGLPSFDRWFKISFRIRNRATFDLRCDDIGPVVPGSTSADPARGVMLNLEGATLPPGINSVDTLRLLPNAGDGGSVAAQPTMIDNIAVATSLTTTGDPIGGLVCDEAMEITYPSVAGKAYQPQYSDNGGATWNDLGSQMTGSDTTKSAFDVAVPGRQYRVMDRQPFGFHGGFVNRTAALFFGASLELTPTAGWGDIDNDGFPELGDGFRLWKNHGGTNFTVLADLPAKIFADIDNDGDLDFYAYRNNSPSLMGVYRNNGGTSFASVGFPKLTSRNDNRGTCWGDWDNDGDPDLYVAAFEFDLQNPPGPLDQPDSLVRNDNGTSFVVNWTEPGTPLRSRGVITCDFDQDQDLDIFVCHYRLQPNYLFVNNGSGFFSNQAPALGADGFQENHPVSAFAHTIGAAWGDFDNDGDFDLFVANFAHPAGWFGIPTNQPESQFLENLGVGGGYAFVDRASDVQLEYQESIGAPALADYDNDGDLDFWAGTAIESGSVGDESPVLCRNDGNWNFTDVTAEAGLSNLGIAYQSAWADFDDDGDLDLMTNYKLFVNKGNGNHWLKVKVDGINQANVGRDAIGTQVKIDLGDGNIPVRQVESGTGEHCSNDLVLHFGLGGRVAPVDLEVTWLNGNTQTIQDVAVDQSVLVQ